LKYSSNFNKQSREVYLEGEGYFEVSKNPHKLFFVNAGEIKAKVYGTSFNIKAFPGENTIETTLIEGELSVIPTKLRGKSDKEILLKPNEKCIYTKVDTKGKPGSETIELSIASHNDSPDSVIFPFKDIPNIILEKKPYLEPEKSWKDGKLVFKNETFGELEIRLERWYNVSIHFENEDIKNYLFTGSFDKETINQAMEALRLSSQESYQYRIEYRDIYLK
jgi:ferric-dicitrate binding protein FerR (iron transport regulator)